MKPDFAEERADHCELRAVVGGEEAPGEVATATRAAACAASTIPFFLAAIQGAVVRIAQAETKLGITSSGIATNEIPASAMEP